MSESPFDGRVVERGSVKVLLQDHRPAEGEINRAQLASARSTKLPLPTADDTRRPSVGPSSTTTARVPEEG